MKLLRLLSMIMLFSSVALGHGGGIDSMGGHRNTAEGNYHFHSGPLAGNTYSSKEEAEAALDALNNPPPDTTLPTTTITGGPSGTITQTSATFNFTGTDDVTTVENLVYSSRLDPLEPTFSASSSLTSRSYTNLENGGYTFHVKAQDQAGNQDSTPATQSFTVDATVLVANFLNGNNTVLNSRVYLWNPSDSAGSITARAYTMPRSGPST